MYVYSKVKLKEHIRFEHEKPILGGRRGKGSWWHTCKKVRPFPSTLSLMQILKREEMALINFLTFFWKEKPILWRGVKDSWLYTWYANQAFLFNPPNSTLSLMQMLKKGGMASNQFPLEREANSLEGSKRQLTVHMIQKSGLSLQPSLTPLLASRKCSGGTGFKSTLWHFATLAWQHRKSSFHKSLRNFEHLKLLLKCHNLFNVVRFKTSELFMYAKVMLML